MVDKSLILVVDDDAGIRKFIKASLEITGLAVSLAEDGEEAIRKVEAELPALILLDIRMPKLDGVEVMRRLRQWSHIPIIMFSGYATDSEKIFCLNLGADDFVAKPFRMEELLARIKAVIRRAVATRPKPDLPAFKCEGLEVNFARRLVLVNGQEVKLTPTEYALLSELVQNANRVVTGMHPVLTGGLDKL